MRPEEQKFLDGLPEGALKEQWRKAYAAVRFNPPTDAPPVVDPKVWTPPPGADTPNTHVDPRKHPSENQDYPFAHPPYFAPRVLSYNQYWELFSQPLAADPVTESINPYRIRLELGDFTPPWQSHPSQPHGGGFCYAWRTAAQWIEHLRTGDRLTAGVWVYEKQWTPGLYDVGRGDVQMVYWMSRTS
jgi:hypothetical protein